jgi:hypothetical protein
MMFGTSIFYRVSPQSWVQGAVVPPGVQPGLMHHNRFSFQLAYPVLGDIAELLIKLLESKGIC